MLLELVILLIIQELGKKGKTKSVHIIIGNERGWQH